METSQSSAGAIGAGATARPGSTSIAAPTSTARSWPFEQRSKRLGVCLDSMLLAEQELRAGSLVVVLRETAMKVRGHGFTTLRSKTGSPKVVAFREWLFAELEQTKAWWESFMGGTRPKPRGCLTVWSFRTLLGARLGRHKCGMQVLVQHLPPPICTRPAPSTPSPWRCRPRGRGAHAAPSGVTSASTRHAR